MNDIYQYLWASSLYITIIGLFFISLRWLMNKINGQQSSIYQLWIIFPMGLVLLLIFQLTDVPMNEVSQVVFWSLPTIQATAQIDNEMIPLSTMAFIFWIVMVSIQLIRLIYQYLSFKKALNKEADVLYKNVKESHFVSSPMAFGIIKPTVYLPKKYSDNLNKQQQLLLIEHELIHCKRYDPLFRMVYKIITIIFWFHPVIYVINKMMKQDQETSVDQLVLDNPNNKTQKVEYSKLLIQFNQKLNTYISEKIPEVYCSSNSMLKERIMLINKNKNLNNSMKNKMASIVLIISAITATVMTTSSLANDKDKNSNKLAVIPQPPSPENTAKSPKPPKVPNVAIVPKAPKAPKELKVTEVKKAPEADQVSSDIKITPIKTVAPYYPRYAVNNKLEGFVNFDMDLDTNGNVLDVRVIESVPEGVFDKEATRSVKQYQFAPLNQPVTVQQKIEFKLADPDKVDYRLTNK
jgi:TonB family protein